MEKLFGSKNCTAIPVKKWYSIVTAACNHEATSLSHELLLVTRFPYLLTVLPKLFRRSFLVASINSELSFNTMPWLDKNHKPDTYGGFLFGNTRDSSMLQLKLWCFPNIWIFWYTKLYCDTFYDKKEDSCRLSGPEKRCKYLASLLYNVMERNSYTTSLF